MSIFLDTANLELQQRVHRIQVLPIIVLYLNNVCDSRCVTCSIWKNNDSLKLASERQMTDALLAELYETLGIWHPRQILLSGGEPVLHPRFAEAVRKFAGICSVGAITNGLSLGSCDPEELKHVSEFYLSFDAPDRGSYERIRGIDGFARLERSLKTLSSMAPRPKIVARCTLQRANVGLLPELVQAARQLGFDRISFLGVDVTSQAFSRDLHGPSEAHAIQPRHEDLVMMQAGIESLRGLSDSFVEGGVEKLERVLHYFRALLGQEEFPAVQCNAPWVSMVIETSGKIRGCFFQPVIGDFRNVNGESAVRFRRSLNVSTDATCQRCVCSKLLGTRDFIRM